MRRRAAAFGFGSTFRDAPRVCSKQAYIFASLFSLSVPTRPPCWDMGFKDFDERPFSLAPTMIDVQGHCERDLARHVACSWHALLV